MVKSIFVFVILATVTTVVRLQSQQWKPWQPAGEKCGCFNNVFVRRPKQIDECLPKEKFTNQIKGNYENIENALRINGDPFRCNFDLFRKRLEKMKHITHQIVEAFYSCNDVDCTPALLTANANYIDYRSNEYNPFIRCVYTNYNANCAQVLLLAWPLAYNSYENVLVGLLSCAKFKLQANVGSINTIPTTSPPPTNNEIECNCVPIEPRPIPKSRLECFSDSFIAKLRNFIDINYESVYNEYDTNSTVCNYSQFYGYVHRLQKITDASTEILKKCNPTMDDVEAYYAKFNVMLMVFGPAVREYILNNDRSCYFSITKSRLNPFSITDGVLGILTKCVGYIDRREDLCSKYLK